MSLTNKEMDEALERVAASDAYALAHCSDNTAEYVGMRYAAMYGNHGLPLPALSGALAPEAGRLFPASRHAGRKYDLRSAWPRSGVVVTLLNEATGEVGDYVLETDGLNGVVVTGYA